MTGVKECINWMLDNPNRKIKQIESTYWYDEVTDTVEYEYNGERCDSLLSYELLKYGEWEPVKEKVDFITAINSGKKMEPVEYLHKAHKKELDDYYKTEMEIGEEYMLDGLFEWFKERVSMDNQIKYINNMWVTIE